MPSCAATPFSKSWRLLSVGSHTMRAPSPSATSTAAGFMPPTSRSQQMPPNTEIASPTSRCTAHASEAVGESCDFSTIARWPGGRRLARRFERVDRPGAVRIGAEVAVQVGRPGQVDAHQRRA